MNSVVIFVFLVITFAMCILELATCDVSLAEYIYVAWIVYALSTPLGQLAIPLALLVAVHLPISCKDRKCCKKQTTEGNEGTIGTASYIPVPTSESTMGRNQNTRNYGST